MKIIVVSDSHGRFEKLQMLKKMYPDVKVFLHCGDCETDEQYLFGFTIVRGNNDYYNYPGELVIPVEKLKIFMTHGHMYYHTNRVEQLVKKAQKLDCQIVCFGHTHRPLMTVEDGILVVNPGSLWINRDGSKPGYVLMEIIDDRVISSEFITF